MASISSESPDLNLSVTGIIVDNTPVAIGIAPDKVSTASNSGSLSSCKSLLYVLYDCYHYNLENKYYMNQ